jgi:hypothetical protein
MFIQKKKKHSYEGGKKYGGFEFSWLKFLSLKIFFKTIFIRIFFSFVKYFLKSFEIIHY